MKQTKELFAKQMSRKEFLQFMGMAVIALFGLNNFILFLRDQQKSAKSKEVAKDPASHGFGSRKFGA
ncbi:MAG: hypothetical protein JWN75_925 [Candidatus Saccharibacteria bacterium]|nr:hypothetical protein [Candidatus Saccharibacteria bacterium]